MSFGVYCVCLPSRRQHTDSFFSALGLTPTYTPVQHKDFDREQLICSGLLHPECTLNDGEIACAISHRNAWNALIDDGFQYGVIFEDDNVIPTEPVDLPSVIEKMVANGCMILNLSPCWSPVTLCRGLFCKPTGVCFNAYILQRDIIDLMLTEVFPLKRPVDKFKFPNHYEVHPRLFRQQGPANTELDNTQGSPEYDLKYLRILVVLILVVMIFCSKIIKMLQCRT